MSKAGPIQKAGKLFAMAMIFMALLLLVIPGIIYNNMASSGLTPAFALSCPGYPDVTCQNSNPSGCQVVPTQCTLSGTKFGILNRASPFTPLLSGNVFGGFSQLNSNGNSNHGPFDSSGGGNYYPANCYVENPSHTSTNMTTNLFAGMIFGCTQANPDYSNTTKAQTFSFNNWNINLTATTQTIPFYQVNFNATYAMTCTNEGFYYVTAQPSVGYATEGCDYYIAAGYSPPQIPNVHPVFSFLIAVPASQAAGGLITGNMPTTAFYHIQAFVQTQNWDTEFCTNSFFGVDLYYQSQQCINMETWFTTPNTGASGIAGSFLTPFIAIIIGMILFIIGCGINVQVSGNIFGTGGGAAIGTNAQGTRFAQALGIGLMIYTPLYSEFAGWFTSGILPNGLDGNLGLIGLTITAIFFGGVFWSALSFGAE